MFSASCIKDRSAVLGGLTIGFDRFTLGELDASLVSAYLDAVQAEIEKLRELHAEDARALLSPLKK